MEEADFMLILVFGFGVDTERIALLIYGNTVEVVGLAFGDCGEFGPGLEIYVRKSVNLEFGKFGYRIGLGDATIFILAFEARFDFSGFSLERWSEADCFYS